MARHTAACRSHRFIGFSLVAVGVLVAASSARAEWPNDPESPLVVGNFDLLTEHSVATSPDGATWVAWADNLCQGSLRLQRIAPDGSLLALGGLIVQDDPSCGNSFPPLIEACADDSVVVYRFGAGALPMLRFSATGEPMWGEGILVGDGSEVVEQLLGLPNGDVLVAWHLGFNVFLQRFDDVGLPVWHESLSIATNNSSNMRIFGLVSDGAGGAFVLWDSPLTYVRLVKAARVTSDGQFAWGPVIVVPAVPGSSRQTDPVAIADGTGGVALVWTVGSDSDFTHVPTYLQRVLSDGTLHFPGVGVRISLDVFRQYNVSVSQDAASGDVLIAWRDDLLDDTTLRAQRMSLDGQRLWGDSGVHVTPLAEHSNSRFDAEWMAGLLTIAVTDETADPEDPGIILNRLDGNGAAIGDPLALSGNTPAGIVHSRPLDEATAVCWLADEGFVTDQPIAAQRVNANGSLGLPVAGDIDGDGIATLDDHAAFVECMTGPAQLVPPVACDPGTFATADVDNDDDTDLGDYGLLANVFGASNP